MKDHLKLQWGQVRHGGPLHGARGKRDRPLPLVPSWCGAISTIDYLGTIELYYGIRM